MPLELIGKFKLPNGNEVEIGVDHDVYEDQYQAIVNGRDIAPPSQITDRHTYLGMSGAAYQRWAASKTLEANMPI